MVIVIFFVLSIVLGSFFTVETAQVAIVQRLGKFARVAGPGLNWKTPFLEAVVTRMSMKVQQFDVQVETKTQDNVFVQIPVSIQYKVIPDGVEVGVLQIVRSGEADRVDGLQRGARPRSENEAGRYLSEPSGHRQRPAGQSRRRR